MSYILVECYEKELPAQVTERMSEGYIPIGGPVQVQSRQASGRPYLMQAMYRPLVQLRALENDLRLSTQELEDAVRESNENVPGSANIGEPLYRVLHAAKSEQRMFAIRKVLGCRAAFLQMRESEAQNYLVYAEELLNQIRDRLRNLQAQPIMQFTNPRTNEERFESLLAFVYAIDGTAAEIAAAVSTRNRTAKPAITVTLEDAVLLSSLLEENNRAQYPNAHQAAIMRFIAKIESIDSEQC